VTPSDIGGALFLCEIELLQELEIVLANQATPPLVSLNPDRFQTTLEGSKNSPFAIGEECPHSFDIEHTKWVNHCDTADSHE